MTSHLISRATRVVALALVLVAVPAPAWSEDPSETRLDRVARAIDLDEDTRAAMREITQELTAENAPRRAAIRKERLLLRSLLEADEPDEAAVMAQVDKLSELQTTLWKTRLSSLMEMRSLLTPVQREKLVALRAREARSSDRACRDDVRTLCPDVIDLRTSVECLLENREQLSDRCRERLSQGRLAPFFRNAR